MYSRYSDRPDKGIQVPEHYSGCAFSGYRTDASPARHLGVAKPTPVSPTPPDTPERDRPPTPLPLPDPPPRGPAPSQDPPRDQDAVKILEPPPKPHSAKELPLPFGHLFSHLGKSMPFSNGLDFDQLLILGLILLFLKNDQDSDVILWLGLLLLCG